MVQRKVPSKLGVQADHHVKSDKRLANLSQDGKTRGGADMKKKMKKSRSIKLSDMDILKSTPPKKSFSQPGKPPPFVQVHPTVSSSSPQKQTPLIRKSDGSPNYMKPTSSSDAKKELFPVSLRNSKCNSKSSSVSAKKPAKALTKSSPSLKLVRTLTKTPSFKKSSRVSLCADLNAQRATCSSTLKDSKFPPYLMLNPGATESEGTSVRKVCPYTYCSLNGHRHAPLPPLKIFLSARRRIMKTQKSMKLEALSPRKLKVPCEPKKESEADMDFFIEIYAKKNGDEEEIGQMGSTKRFGGEENIKSTTDDDMKQVVASLSDGSPKSEIDSEEAYGKYFDDAKIKADSKGSFIQKQVAEFADEKHLPIWSGEEISIGSYSSEGEVDGSNSVATDMEWEHEEDDADSSVLTEENDSKVESSSESSHDVSVMWLDDIINIYYENVVAEVSQESKAKEIIYFESQHYGIHCGMERTNESLETQEGNSGENETVMDATVHSSNFSKTFGEQEETGEQILENNDVSEAENLTNNEVLELENDGADCITTVHTNTLDEQENTPLQQDDLSMSQADLISDASQECYELNQFETEEDVADNHFTPVEEPLMAETNDKMEKEDNEDFKEETVGNYVSDASQDGCESSEVESSQGQKVSESCEADKVSEKENSSQDISEEDNLESSSSTGGEEKGPSNNWKGAERRKRAVQEEDEMRKFNPREPNFLPLVPDPEAEKVDLKHQMMDERKNAEEWMLDYALRQTVTKLAPARKRKVALLVEAFESVTPIPKCETHMRNKSSFAHPRPIQACR
ncbi:calmodulin binding protein PICBP isoform X1 [Neltuma alba]|uniref:calmodulin binding protein PICBP isoform X1 n=1 Tax=Neltuma alba TaxID=207710 RepID=UPI0010A3DCA5|nr:calmodulin binding protein PICBP-like isoform X1 [Prosopis alba]XP_028788863.1 calmodulin binding protein PICBP-like isoform X1 [Prosopis alba]